MTVVTTSFFEAVLTAGAILSGFCGTFLAFKLQREATYYRQPAVDFRTGKGRDVFIGLTHFTSPFLLLILATSLSAIFGFVLPLLALSGQPAFAPNPRLIVGGVLGALFLLAAYFLDELVHYGILGGRLARDAKEWKAEWWIVSAGILAALACVTYFALNGPA